MASFPSQRRKLSLPGCCPAQTLRLMAWEVPMGYPKHNSPDILLPPRGSRPGADMISLTAHRLTRPKSQAKPHISGADQRALARIAERFAHGAPSGPAACAQPGTVPEDAAPKDASKDQPFDQRLPQSPILA